MIEQQDEAPKSDTGTSGSEPSPTRSKKVRRRVVRRELPQFRVVLHNDDVNQVEDVIRTLTRLTPLSKERATLVTLHAHLNGDALILITHKERAELYVSQFRAKHLTVSIEPDR
jgi:ATP-dependent Clp protease adapter protein ClpS